MPRREIWTHSGWARTMARYLLFYIFGWDFIDSDPDANECFAPPKKMPKKAVVVCWPHTSYWDSFFIYFICMVTHGYGLTRAGWLGSFLEFIGAPVWQVDRKGKLSQTDQIAKIIKEHDKCLLYLAAGGTTKRT